MFEEQLKEANAIINLQPDVNKYTDAIFDSYYLIALYHDLHTQKYDTALEAVNNAIKMLNKLYGNAKAGVKVTLSSCDFVLKLLVVLCYQCIFVLN